MSIDIKSFTSIPDTHKDLLEQAICVVLVTVMPDGQPQASVVWCNYDGANIKVNTARGRLKERNMSARPMATVLAIDPQNPYRYMEIRGSVEEITEEGAIEHRNELGKLYLRKSNYYGETGIGPDEPVENHVRVICKIKPQKVIAVNH